MWPRKQLDIGWADLAFGLANVFSPGKRPPGESLLGADWIPAHEAVVSLSVRTGWDLLLTALRLPPGSEILMSAVTIPDMVRIVEHHGLVAVPVDVDSARLEPVLDELERAVSPRSRAIVVAHLFGARFDMAPIHCFARQHGLFVIEDCAQAFVGRDYAGHPETNCAMFSFGPIKTATALGGAVLRVRDPGLRALMRSLQRHYPIQRRWAYFKRLAKYALFHLLCKPRLYGTLMRLYGWLGRDYDRAFSNATHSFGARDFIGQLRQRPCGALLRMLARRLRRFEPEGLAKLQLRTARGWRLAEWLPRGLVVGGQNSLHTFWVMPVAAANGPEVIDALRAAGFDATGRSSLAIVRRSDAPDGIECATWLAHTIFLPNGDDMPDAEWGRMIDVLRTATIRCSLIGPEPSPRAAVSLSP